MESTNGDIKVRKTLKPEKLDQLDMVTHQWYIQAHSQGIHISGPIIMAMVIEVNKKDWWRSSFQSEHDELAVQLQCQRGICQLDISGEKLTADSSVIAEY